MANIAAFMCGLMLAQVERDNARRANRRLLSDGGRETPLIRIPNTLNDKLYTRLLQKDSSLKELLITEEFFTNDLSQSKGRLIRARDKIESFVKGDNAKWRNVKKALLRHCSIKKLEIHHVPLHDSFLCCVVHKMPQLTHLTLSGNDVGDTGACSLAKSLATSKTTLLTSLVLNSQSIFDDGAIHLATALSSSHTTLLYLSLKHNFIKNAGACALARMLTQHNTTLQRLDLSQNFIHATGAIALAAALEHNTTLKELDLSCNDNDVTLQCIGDAGTKAFGAALKKNTTLEVLKLSANHIGPSGCKALAEGLKANTSLKELYLDNNSIGLEGFTSLCKALETNTCLEIVSLQDTMVPIETCVQQALVQALNKNTSLLEMHSTVVSAEGAFLLELNRGLRKILRDDKEVPWALWPHVLERASREPSEYMRLNLAYYTIQQRSDLFRR